MGWSLTSLPALTVCQCVLHPYSINSETELLLLERAVCPPTPTQKRVSSSKTRFLYKSHLPICMYLLTFTITLCPKTNSLV